MKHTAHSIEANNPVLGALTLYTMQAVILNQNCNNIFSLIVTMHQMILKHPQNGSLKGAAQETYEDNMWAAVNVKVKEQYLPNVTVPVFVQHIASFYCL